MAPKVEDTKSLASEGSKPRIFKARGLTVRLVRHDEATQHVGPSAQAIIDRVTPMLAPSLPVGINT